MSSTTSVSPTAPSKGLHIGLWIAQSLGAFAFFGAGLTKVMTPIAELATKMSFVASFPPAAVRAIGIAEVLGALGLILPSALRIAPKLTPLAATGLFLLMLGAIRTHIAMGETGGAVAPLVLGLLMAFVIWGRTTKAPITAR